MRWASKRSTSAPARSASRTPISTWRRSTRPSTPRRFMPGLSPPMSVNKKNNLGYFFADAVARYADKVAIIDLHGGIERQVSYAQLDERADRVAGLVRSLGVQPGERVGMIVGNRVEFLEIFFGAMRAGAIPVAINTRLARETLKFILEDAECRAVFVEPEAHPNAMDIAKTTPNVISLHDYEAMRDKSARLEEPPALPANAQAF